LREQLVGGASSKLLPPAPDDYPLPEEAREWGADPATAVAEPPGVDESVTGVETVPMADTVTFTEPEEAVRPWGDADAVTSAEEVAVDESPGEDLRPRIEETRSAIETDIAEPFALAGAETPVAAAAEPVVEEPVVEESVVEEPAAEEPAVEEPAVEEPVAEEPVALPVVETPVVEEPVAQEVVEPVVAEKPCSGTRSRGRGRS